MLALGLMSGTSCDGVDAAIIETNGHTVRRFIAEYYLPYDDDFAKKLCAIIEGKEAYFTIENQLTDYHIKVVEEVQKLSGVKPEVIGFHGQTIFHDPSRAITCQIGNPHMLAAHTKINVVADFRRRDMAFGGQGAPLVPIFHKAIIQKYARTVAIVNIGGVSNITYIDGDEILLGYDVGPGNAYINDAMRKYYDKSFDEDGRIAASGAVNNQIVEKFLADPFFKLSIPKSLDRNHFAWVIKELSSHKPEDVIATLTMITVKAIANMLRELSKKPEKIVICGGGGHNKTIMKWLQIEMEPLMVLNINSFGFKADFIEAQAFAFLAVRYLKNLPSTFPSTTGVSRATISGVLFPF